MVNQGERRRLVGTVEDADEAAVELDESWVEMGSLVRRGHHRERKPTPLRSTPRRARG